MTHSEMGYIIRISRCFSLYRKNLLGDTDLGPSHMMLISHVCRHPGSTQDELAESLCLDKTTASRHVATLEKLGYISREVSKVDARYKEVYPTEKAEELYPALRTSFRDFYTGLIQDLSEEERSFLSQTLEKMYDHAMEMSFSKDTSSSKDAASSKDVSKHTQSERKPL